MEAVREHTTVKASALTVEQQKHNAMINERYKRLQSAEADQFANVTEAPVEARSDVFTAPVYSASPAVAQMPQVTEFVPARSENPVFTTEKFARINNMQSAAVATAPMTATRPTLVANVTAVAPAKAASVATQEHYSLSSFAKIVMAVFTLVIVAMISLICINTRAIENKRVHIRNLEEKQERLLQEYDELQQRIAEATSDETIRAYAEAMGMVKA